MKIKLSKIVIRIMMLPLCLTGQTTSSTDPVLISWENNYVSVLSELEPVWIILKKGGPIKKVRLREIQNEKGIIVYEKENCLHDLSIKTISRITAGYYSKSAIFFDENNVPLIKTIELVAYEGETYADFKHNENFQSNDVASTKKFISGSNETASSVRVTPEEKKTTLALFNDYDVADTIVREDGEIIAVKILEISSTRIRFKKLNNSDGPSYIIGNQPFVKIIRSPNGIKVILTNH